MSEIFPADALVVHFPAERFYRKYLVRTEPGVDLWELSKTPEGDDYRPSDPRSAEQAVDYWFAGLTDAQHWTVVESEPKAEKVDPRLVGPVPTPPKTPKYVLPFKIEDGTRVVDAQGYKVVDVDLDHAYEYGDDTAMAQLIRDAVNAYLS